MPKIPEDAQRAFQLDLDKFTKGFLPEHQNRFTRKVALDVLRGVTMRSPVDTGRFRGAWVVGVNTPDTSDPNTPDQDGDPTISRGLDEIGGAQAGDKIHISNNVVYAVPLEYGHSSKAPNGMIAVTIADVTADLERTKGKPVEDI